MAEHTHPEIEHLLNRLEAFFATSHQMMGRLAPADVLGTETAELPPTGSWSRSWQLPARAVAVTNLSGTPLVVNAGPAGNSAPSVGAGVVPLGPGASTTVALAANAISVWGRAGARFTITALSKLVPSVSSPTLGISQTNFAGGALCSPVAAAYAGFSLREATGTATALVRIWDTSTSGQLLDEVSLSAGESARELYPHLIPTAGGAWAELWSGAVEGTVRWA